MPSLGVFPSTFVAFVATALLGFLVGLELHSYRREAGPDLGFGTTRTLTLIAVLGFALWLIDPSRIAYSVGLASLAALLMIYYWRRTIESKLSLLPILIAILTYGLGAVALTQPVWFLILLVVTVIVMLGEQPGIRRLSDAFPGDEAVTLAKFLILLGVVLPLLPAQPLGKPFGGLTYRDIWLAVVAVSAISYLSYVAQRYLLPRRGLLLSGVLGGLYSSTAVTAVLARRARETSANPLGLQSAIIVATGMMYLRLWVIVAVVGHWPFAVSLSAPFASAFLACMAMSYILERRAAGASSAADAIRNPLELPMAFLFAFLLVIFVAASQYALERFGSSGLNTLALFAGFGDVDAFVLALLTGKFPVTAAVLTKAMILVTATNNALKAGVILAMARRRALLLAISWLLGLAVVSVLYGLWEFPA